MTPVVLSDLGVSPYSAGIDFSRQNLTSVDVKSRVKIFIMKKLSALWLKEQQTGVVSLR